MTVLTLAFLAASALLSSVAVFLRRPAATLATWLMLLIVFPYWFGVHAGVFVPFCVVTAVVLIVPALFSARMILEPLDLIMASFAAICLAASLTGLATWYDTAVVLAQWCLGYFLGRVWSSSLSRVGLATIMTAFGGTLAALSCLEFLLSWHPFVSLFPGSAVFNSWSWIQYRGGQARSEWSFGHSIALGNVIAMCVPFVFFSRMKPWLMVGTIAIMTAGVAATFSRNALIAVGLGLALGLWLAPSGATVRQRLSVSIAVFAASSIIILPGILVWSSAGDEVASSTDYRFQMLSLLRDINVLGSSGTLYTLSDGQPGYASTDYLAGAARSIDNTFVLLGLNLGWIAVLLSSVVVLAIAFLQIKRQRRTAAGLAVVAQLPTLMTVAMITQYSIVFWAIAGMAASGLATRTSQRGASGQAGLAGLDRATFPLFLEVGATLQGNHVLGQERADVPGALGTVNR